MGRYDADFGSVLLNKGKGNFEYMGLPGLSVKGQIRHIERINVAGKEAFILARNNDTAKIISFR